MLHWVAASTGGILLGLLLFGCVRLRMYLGPIIKESYGEWARRAYWLATIGVMILLANLGLFYLRSYLGGLEYDSSNLLLEILFAVLALVIAMSLIFNRLYRNR